jgi:hypothetical protein
VEGDAFGEVALGEGGGDLGRDVAGQEPRQRLDDGDMRAEAAGGGGAPAAGRAPVATRSTPTSLKV